MYVKMFLGVLLHVIKGLLFTDLWTQVKCLNLNCTQLYILCTCTFNISHKTETHKFLKNYKNVVGVLW